MFSSPFRAALAFQVAWLVFEATVLQVGYGEWLSLRLSFRAPEFWPGAAAFAASTTLVWLFVYASLRAVPLVRVVYFAIFTLAVGVEYAYQYAFGRFSEFSDYEVGLFAANANIVAGAVAAYTNLLFVIPCAAYGALLLTMRAPAARSWRSTGRDLVVLVTVVALLGGTLAATARREIFQYPALSVAASFRTLTSLPWMLRWNPAIRDEVAFRAPTAPRDNVVFIVDESVRGDHLSINGYGRPTTPLLEDLAARGLLVNWGVAAAATTCSVSTNLALLTGVHPTESHTAPTIFQYAQAMGYRTHYLDAQMTRLWNGTSRDRGTWDVWLTANEFQRDGLAFADARAGTKASEILRASVGNFVWINKFGVHTAYDVNYPPSEAVWTPVFDEPGVALTAMVGPRDTARRAAFVNSYDNAVRWSLESFFKALLKDGIPPQTTIVYTADHGQTLGEAGERHSHCGASRTEAMVPLFIISSAHDLARVDTSYKASHANLFATLLDLMRYPEAERRRRYEVSLLEARGSESRPRKYLVGLGRALDFDLSAQ